jgi:hypothetical protein
MSTYSFLLQEKHKHIVAEERALLNRLSKALKEIDAPKEDIFLVEDACARIVDFFTVVIVGEFNAGSKLCRILILMYSS